MQYFPPVTAHWPLTTGRWYPKRVVRMIWWFLIVAVAAGAVLWAVLSAYVQVRQRLAKAENRPPGQTPAGHES